MSNNVSFRTICLSLGFNPGQRVMKDTVPYGTDPTSLTAAFEGRVAIHSLWPVSVRVMLNRVITTGSSYLPYPVDPVQHTPYDEGAGSAGSSALARQAGIWHRAAAELIQQDVDILLDWLCGRSIYSTLLLLAGADPQHFAQHTGATRGARSPPSEGRTRALVSQDDSWRPD